MAAKKTSKRSVRPAPVSPVSPRPEDPNPDTGDPLGGLQMIATTLGNHDAAIRQLAEVVVNLHQNIRALRDVVEPLADRSNDERVIQARNRLRRVKLDE